MSKSRGLVQRTLADSVWPIPLLFVLGGIALALGLIAVDRAGDYQLVSTSVTGGASAVQQILTTTAASLVSLMSIVLSLTLVAVQLAMQQFSPRIVRTLFADRRNQIAVGLFTATFVYTILVLREIDDQKNLVPGVAVLVAYLLTLLSLVALFLFVYYASRSIRVSGIIDRVGDSTHAQLERLEPLEDSDAGEDQHPNLVLAPEAGNVNMLDRAALVALARDAGTVIELVPPLGDFVSRGAPLVRVEATLSADQRKALLRAIEIAPERTHEDDPSFGLRKLVDIAQRAIASSPFDDPTTTVQALHRIQDCMRVLATRKLPDGHCRDDEGNLRFVYRTLDWPGYVRLAFDELRLVGAGSPQVARKLRATLEDLKRVAPEVRQAPLDRQLDLLEEAVRREVEEDPDLEAALAPDGMGIGGGADVVTSANGGAGGSRR
jgi:uncharacterized membrane protein